MNKQESFMISHEFFPPKTIEGEKNLADTANILAETSPHFFSVTFGAGGSTREGTLKSVKMLLQDTTTPVAPHLSCIGSSTNDIVDIINQYKALGVKRIVALRGDLPSGMGHGGDLRYASELVALIRQTTEDYFHIEVAAYPECHPQSHNALDDILHFQKKVNAGANSAITQYFFNSDAYFYFRDMCTKHGIFIPITPGIMPITNFSKLVRFSDMCGAEIPRWIRRRLETYGDDHESIQAFGLEVVNDLCQRLIAGGVPGLHFYTLNHAEATVSLLKLLNLSDNTLAPNKTIKAASHPVK